LILRARTLEGVSRPLAFSRTPHGIPNKPLHYDEVFDSIRVGEDRPVPLVSNLSPSRDLSLSLRLGKRLGRGSSGVVHEAFVHATNSSAPLATGLPPLVVKISYHDVIEPAAHEAYYYETLQPLQGVNIPRYYGRFLTDLSCGTCLVHTSEHGIAEDLETIDISHRPGVEDSASDNSPGPEEETVTSRPTTNSLKAVSVLLLERLGSHLPMHMTLSDALMCVKYILLYLIGN
jgi:hypothetical protein